ncbi:uncharacterized protein [Arachis hypogaea]|uniref:uncharacterized protein n=1 Tax=Arachis hypogaea TaxID=3818 RepID=UPI00110571F1|nr:uncharacterized protein LOC114925808 [Arachis hypogaea]
MAARSRQAALDEIQETYMTQYKRIVDYCSELLRSNPESTIKLKLRRSPDFGNEVLCKTSVQQLQEEVSWPSLEATDMEVRKGYTLEGLEKRDGNNPKESREKPIVTMMKEIRVYLMSTWNRNKERVQNFSGTILPQMRKKVERRSTSAGEWRPYWSVAQSYEVVNGLNKCYDSVIYPVNGPDLWEKTDFDDVMPPPYGKPSHRPVKNRKKGPEKAEDRSQSHLSRREQIQKCSNCGESGHNARGEDAPSHPPCPTI